MSKKKQQTAEEFVTELEKDPDFVRRRVEKDKKSQLLRTRLEEISRPFLKKLEEAAGWPQLS